MATTETPKKLRLQSVGWVPAVEASELKVGDQLMYNFGSVCQIVKIEEASPKFLRVHEVSTERGTEYQRRVKKTSMVARVPEKDRRRVGSRPRPPTTGPRSRRPRATWAGSP